jgi:DNA-binding NtrC family response regulator
MENITAKVLLVEDDESFRRFLTTQLHEQYHIIEARHLKQGIDRFKQENPDVVVLDVNIPGENGLSPEKLGFQLLKQILEIDAAVPVIIISGIYKDVNSVVEAMKIGAFDYIDKVQFGTDPDKFPTALRNAVRQRQLQRDNLQLNRRNEYFLEVQKSKFHLTSLPRASSIHYHFNNLVGSSAAMQKIYQNIEKLSRDPNVGVLITGEAGTGKELVAASIHFNSSRRDKPFVIADLSSLPSTLIESQLFGHVKGAFTDAKSDKAGFFEQANHSTLVIDEIAEVPVEIQVKLLRVIETHKIRRLGSDKEISVDVRIVALTNKDMEQAVREEEFREDLYYRINIIRIHLPPLRERKEDILELMLHFLEKHQIFEKRPITIADAGLQLFFEHDWPGNVRELRNVIHRAVVLREKDEITQHEIRQAILTERPFFQKLATQHGGQTGKTEPKPLPILTDLDRAPGEAHVTEIGDANVKDAVILREFIESRGNLTELSDKLDITRATGTKYFQQIQEAIFIELCQVNGNIELLAQQWGVSSEDLRASLLAKHRFIKYIQQVEKKYQNHLEIARRIGVQPENLENAIHRIREIDPD